jgi:hypothetical protein
MMMFLVLGHSATHHNKLVFLSLKSSIIDHLLALAQCGPAASQFIYVNLVFFQRLELSKLYFKQLMIVP